MIGSLRQRIDSNTHGMSTRSGLRHIGRYWSTCRLREGDRQMKTMCNDRGRMPAITMLDISLAARMSVRGVERILVGWYLYLVCIHYAYCHHGWCCQCQVDLSFEFLIWFLMAGGGGRERHRSETPCQTSNLGRVPAGTGNHHLCSCREIDCTHITTVTIFYCRWTDFDSYFYTTE